MNYKCSETNSARRYVDAKRGKREVYNLKRGCKKGKKGSV
jgi:hypothetical protein